MSTTEELDTTSLVVGALVVPLALAFGVGIGLLDAFVLWKIWTWHAVPLGAIAVPYGTVVAADLFVSLVILPLHPERQKDGYWKRVAEHLALLVVAFTLAWLAR